MLDIKRLMGAIGLGVLLVPLAACEIHIDGGDYVKGSGDAISKDIDVASFEQVILKSSTDVAIQVGKAQTVKLTADDNLIDMFTFEVDGKTLIIDHEGSYSTRIGTKVDISVPSLDVIAVKGSGEIRVDDAKGDDFVALISGSGDIILDDLDVDLLELEVDGSGDIKANGRADKVDADVNGSGDIKLLKLDTKVAKVQVSGSGDIEVDASDKLTARVNGSGDIRYSGSPKVDSRVNGSGDIEQI